jgi:hypothetical protein
MDKALVGLMEDLDSGKVGPAFLKLMVGNMLVFGEPCSEKDFAEAFIWAETDLGMKRFAVATGDAVCLKGVTALIWTTESMTVPRCVFR